MFERPLAENAVLQQRVERSSGQVTRLSEVLNGGFRRDFGTPRIHKTPTRHSGFKVNYSRI